VRVATGFDRPNLSFAVVPCPTKEAAHRGITEALREPTARPAIVYTGTRAECDRLAGRLARDLGVPVAAYHAGLARDARAEAQRRFMADESPVVVATNAFGMGVDKANVRTVCHEAVPGSIEAYYQEAGRAGRDGAPARALLFASAKDKGLHVFFIQRSEVRDELLTAVARRLTQQERFDVSLRELGFEAGDEEAVRAIAGHLAQAGVIQPSPSSPDRLVGRVSGRWDARALAACRAAGQEATRVRWRQYRAVWGWVEESRCRRVGILRHFGDTSEPSPGVDCCDVCRPQLRPAIAAAGSRRGSPARPAQLAQRPVGAGEAEALDEAIFDVVAAAEPPVGRTRAVEVLRGGRSKVIAQNSYDGLPHYGTFGHLTAATVLERVDALLQAGSLRSTGGRFPKLEVV
jgi:ATP-dependent DNA helicase RecQ